MGTKRRPLRHEGKTKITRKLSRHGKVATSVPWRVHWGSTFGVSRRRCRPRLSRAACPRSAALSQQLPLLGFRRTQSARAPARVLAVAGWPDCRAAYERNLAEAEEWSRLPCLAGPRPECPSPGTGTDRTSLRQRLKEAKTEVAYRKKLLAELDAKETARRTVTQNLGLAPDCFPTASRRYPGKRTQQEMAVFIGFIRTSRSGPLNPRKRTCALQLGMSALWQ